MDLKGAIKSLPRPPSIPFFILVLRVALLFFAAVNLCALTAAFQLYSPINDDGGINTNTTKSDNPKNSNDILLSDRFRYFYYNFNDTEQLVVNCCLFVAGVYSFLGNSQWNRRVRLATGSALVACNVALIGWQFRKMVVSGGCEVGKAYNYNKDATTPLKRRCWIQLVVGSIGAGWALLLAIELCLTNIQRKRELNQKAQSHQRAQEDQVRQQELCSVVHYYQPDLSSLEEGGGGGGEERPGTGAGEESVELETLPPYQRRAPGPRPVIVDLGDMGRVSLPPSRRARLSTRTPTRTTSRGQSHRPNVIQPPAPSHQAPRYSTLSHN